MFIAPMVGASDERMYVSCAQSSGQKPAAKRHPNNCMISAAGVHQHSGVPCASRFSADFLTPVGLSDRVGGSRGC